MVAMAMEGSALTSLPKDLKSAKDSNSGIRLLAVSDGGPSSTPGTSVSKIKASASIKLVTNAATNTHQGIYTVVGKDLNGCENTKTMK